MASSQRKDGAPDYPALTELKGSPRGLLLYYVLHSISIKPRHGYEILQDIDNRTEGAWRPGVGSVYPILKKLLARGYVKADERGEAETRRVYSITDKGLAMMKHHGDAFTGSVQRWMAMRRLYFDLLDPAGLSAMVLEGSKRQFEITKELLESKRDALSRTDAEFTLREYGLNLERQLDWTNSQLKDLRARPGHPKIR
ncbi:MAG: PadR family transcriptional regulator [Nitrososphaerales archaeon]